MSVWRIVSILALLAQTAVAGTLTLTDLGTLGGPTAVAYKVNEQGQVSVDSTTTGNTSWQPFLWDAGVKQPAIPLPAGGKSYAFGLNDLGVQVGRQDVTNTDSRAVVWTGGVPVELPSFGTAQATAINNAGVVVGSSGASVWTEGPVYWDLSGIHALPVLPGGATGVVWDVNDSGWMAGWAESSTSWQGVLWAPDGSIVEITDALAADASFSAINAAGHAVGTSYVGPTAAPILWDGMAVSALAVPTGMGGRATGIADNGLIVGYVFDPSTWALTGVYWDDAGMHDVNTPDILAQGWRIEALWGVNEDGWMVGEGVYAGHTRAILLKPVPLPSAVWLGLAALAVLAGWGRRCAREGRAGR